MKGLFIALLVGGVGQNVITASPLLRSATLPPQRRQDPEQETDNDEPLGFRINGDQWSENSSEPHDVIPVQPSPTNVPT
jgi:hypothetical protein